MSTFHHKMELAAPAFILPKSIHAAAGTSGHANRVRYRRGPALTKGKARSEAEASLRAFRWLETRYDRQQS